MTVNSFEHVTSVCELPVKIYICALLNSLSNDLSNIDIMEI